MAFRVAQISDTHLGGRPAFLVDNVRRVIDAIAAERPDLVVATGDISLDGADGECDLAAALRRRRFGDVFLWPRGITCS